MSCDINRTFIKKVLCKEFSLYIFIRKKYYDNATQTGHFGTMYAIARTMPTLLEKVIYRDLFVLIVGLRVRLKPLRMAYRSLYEGVLLAWYMLGKTTWHRVCIVSKKPATKFLKQIVYQYALLDSHFQ